MYADKVFQTGSIEVKQVNTQVWDAFAITTHTGGLRRKKIGQFCLDVDGGWLFFFTGTPTGGWQRHTLADLSAAFTRFLDLSGPKENTPS